MDFCPGIPCLCPGGHGRRPAHLLLPLPQRDHLQPGVLHLWLVTPGKSKLYVDEAYTIGIFWSFLDWNGNLFRWFNVDCSLAEGLYSLNDEIAAEAPQAAPPGGGGPPPPPSGGFGGGGGGRPQQGYGAPGRWWRRSSMERRWRIAVVSGYFSDVCILWMKMFPIAIDWKCFPLPFKSFPSFAQTNLIFNPVYTSCESELDTYLLFSTISFVKHPLIVPLISFRWIYDWNAFGDWRQLWLIVTCWLGIQMLYCNTCAILSNIFIYHVVRYPRMQISKLGNCRFVYFI